MSLDAEGLTLAGTGDTYVDLSEMPPGTAEAVAEELDRFSEWTGRLRAFAPLDEDHPHADRRESSTAIYCPGDASIRYTPSLTHAEARRAHRAHGFVGSGVSHTIAHEVGHHAHHMALYEDGCAHQWDALGKGEFTGETKRAIEDEVGRYAATSPLELVAEVFAAKTLDAAVFSPDVEFVYRDLGGPDVAPL